MQKQILFVLFCFPLFKAALPSQPDKHVGQFSQQTALAVWAKQEPCACIAEAVRTH